MFHFQSKANGFVMSSQRIFSFTFNNKKPFFPYKNPSSPSFNSEILSLIKPQPNFLSRPFNPNFLPSSFIYSASRSALIFLQQSIPSYHLSLKTEDLLTQNNEPDTINVRLVKFFSENEKRFEFSEAIRLR